MRPERKNSLKADRGVVGQVGGRVRPPMLELTKAEKEATRKAFETCGLKVPGAAHKSSAA